MIKPIVGRVVLVHLIDAHEIVPALICSVICDTCINVGGFDAQGKPFAAQYVYLTGDDEPPLWVHEQNVTWAEWMPFQKGQAAKTDEYAKALEGRPTLQQLDALLKSEDKLKVVVLPDGSINAAPDPMGEPPLLVAIRKRIAAREHCTHSDGEALLNMLHEAKQEIALLKYRLRE